MKLKAKPAFLDMSYFTCQPAPAPLPKAVDPMKEALDAVRPEKPKGKRRKAQMPLDRQS